MGLFDLLTRNKSSKVVYIENESLQDNKINGDMLSKKTGNVSIEEIKLNTENINLIKNRFISFDIETTGLDSFNDRIIEIGAIVFENCEKKDMFGTLVNPNKLNSSSAMEVNNISNEMILDAPSEEIVYKKFIQFIGEDALDGKTIFCAHNGIFDFKFLANTLNRFGYNGTIKYVDTLKIARYCIYEVDNYKLGTLADYFNIVNAQEHRAADDAIVCGKILINLLPFLERKNEQKIKKMESQKFSELEYLICSYIKKMILDNNYRTDLLKFEKVSGEYISCKYLYNFIKFKITKNGIYFLIKNEYLKETNLLIDNASISEGGVEYSRVYINSIDDINVLQSCILSEYMNIVKSADYYIDNSEYRMNRVEEFISTMVEITNDDMFNYLDKISDIELPKVNVKVKKNIDRKDIDINPINARISCKQIQIRDVNYFDNYNDYVKSMDKFYELCSNVDSFIDKKEYDIALEKLDEIRANGYLFGCLYEKYLKIYSALKDYDNIIDILDEAIPIMKKNKEHTINMETKLQNVINQKYKVESERLEQEKKKLEKQLLKEKTIQLKKNKKETTSKKRDTIEGRHVIQLDDDGNTIKSYVSVAEAVRDTGINSKSIRDAANGVQKHAGGYVWKYNNDEN